MFPSIETSQLITPGSKWLTGVRAAYLFIDLLARGVVFRNYFNIKETRKKSELHPK